MHFTEEEIEAIHRELLDEKFTRPDNDGCCRGRWPIKTVIEAILESKAFQDALGAARKPLQ